MGRGRFRTAIGAADLSGVFGPQALDDLPGTFDGPVACAGCDATIEVWPAPAWLASDEDEDPDWMGDPPKTEPDLVVSADRPDGAASGTAEARSGAVAFQCSQCGGSLDLTRGGHRTTTCSYCGASQYVPDEVWLALHPVRVRRMWWVRFRREGTGEVRDGD